MNRKIAISNQEFNQRAIDLGSALNTLEQRAYQKIMNNARDYHDIANTVCVVNRATNAINAAWMAVSKAEVLIGEGFESTDPQVR